MVNIIQVVCMHFTEKYLFLHWICIPIVLSHCKRIYSKILIMQHTATNKQPTNKYRPLHLQRDLFILHIYSVEISYVFDKTSQFVIETRTALTAKTEKCYWYLYKVKDDDARIHLNTPQWWIDFLVSIFPIVISSFFCVAGLFFTLVRSAAFFLFYCLLISFECQKIPIFCDCLAQQHLSMSSPLDANVRI